MVKQDDVLYTKWRYLMNDFIASVKVALDRPLQMFRCLGGPQDLMSPPSVSSTTGAFRRPEGRVGMIGRSTGKLIKAPFASGHKLDRCGLIKRNFRESGQIVRVVVGL